MTQRRYDPLVTDDPGALIDNDGPGPRGIQSIEIGFRLLQCLVKAPGPLSLKTLAERAGVSASRARFYLVSFIKLGLIAQDRHHGQYELGPYARHLGLVAIQRMDVVRIAAQPLRRLCDRVEQSVFLTVWGNRGPTIVLTLDAYREIPMSVRVGYVMPLLYTATGRAFLSHLPRQATKKLVDEGLEAAAGSQGETEAARLRDSLDQVAEECRAAGFAHTKNVLNAGFAGVAAPVFDYRGWTAAVITVIGPANQIDADPEGECVRALRETAEKVSADLGFVGEAPEEASRTATVGRRGRPRRG